MRASPESMQTYLSLKDEHFVVVEGQFGGGSEEEETCGLLGDGCC
jgi:hypothetical protein